MSWFWVRVKILVKKTTSQKPCWFNIQNIVIQDAKSDSHSNSDPLCFWWLIQPCCLFWTSSCRCVTGLLSQESHIAFLETQPPNQPCWLFRPTSAERGHRTPPRWILLLIWISAKKSNELLILRNWLWHFYTGELKTEQRTGNWKCVNCCCFSKHR